jgi:hypothetical protein
MLSEHVARWSCGRQSDRREKERENTWERRDVGLKLVIGSQEWCAEGGEGFSKGSIRDGQACARSEGIGREEILNRKNTHKSRILQAGHHLVREAVWGARRSGGFCGGHDRNGAPDASPRLREDGGQTGLQWSSRGVSGMATDVDLSFSWLRVRLGR